MYSHVIQTSPVDKRKEFLVLIHGLGGRAASWDRVIPQLTSRFNILRYDLRGHGQSEIPPGPWSLDDFVQDLEGVLGEVKITQTHLVGFSLGGLIAQKFTLKNPMQVNKLVILSAVAGRTEAEREKVVQRLRNLENNDLDANIELAMERWFSPGFRQNHPELVQQRVDGLRSTDPKGYLNAHRVFSLGDLASELPKIKNPTLIMTGEFDPGSNVRMAQLMHERISGSKIEILPNLRHSVLVEAPELIGQKLVEFL